MFRLQGVEGVNHDLSKAAASNKKEGAKSSVGAAKVRSQTLRLPQFTPQSKRVCGTCV